MKNIGRKKTTLLSCLMLFSLMLALTNFCVAMLFYPVAVKAAEPTVQSHAGCGDLQELPIAKIKITAKDAGNSLMPCCVGRSQDSGLALVATEKPLAQSMSVAVSDYQHTLQNFPPNGRVAELWPPPELIIINSIIIRI